MNCLTNGSSRLFMQRLLFVGSPGTTTKQMGSSCFIYTTRSKLYINPICHASTKVSRSKTAIFFPGQGVQKVGMLGTWLKSFPVTAGRLIEEIDHLMGFKFSTIIQEGPNSLLSATVNSQPAIMACSILILRIMEKEFSFNTSERVDFALGHSLGEFAALVAAGNMTFEDSLYLVRKRAEIMAECTKKITAENGGEYGMVALVTEPGKVSSLIQAIQEFIGHHSVGSKSESSEDMPPIQQTLIANINSENQIVLSGNIERIMTLLTHVRQISHHDPRAVRLNVDCPFHSPIMIPAKKMVQSILKGKSRVKSREDEDIVVFPGVIDCVSNISARPFSSRTELKDLCARSCVETVRWWESIKYLDQEQGVRRWIGIGPGKVGRNLVGKEVGMRGKDSVRGGGVWAITDPRECEEVIRALDDTDSHSNEN